MPTCYLNPPAAPAVIPTVPAPMEWQLPVKKSQEAGKCDILLAGNGGGIELNSATVESKQEAGGVHWGGKNASGKRITKNGSSNKTGNTSVQLNAKTELMLGYKEAEQWKRAQGGMDQLWPFDRVKWASLFCNCKGLTTSDSWTAQTMRLESRKGSRIQNLLA
ncbi:hypothetical protein BDZ91DRAFT_765436 [Kalaharituber pfeilii]|nr:hypothetical protein BDZ91DRAFT_765436 [Kalaharituber pfeilii]